MQTTLRLFVIGALACAACHRLTPTEAKLVGTWQNTVMDMAATVIVRRDHTFTISFDGKEPSPGGKWRVEGNQLVIDEFEPQSSESPERKLHSETISELTSDKLVMKTGVTWTRVK